MTLRDGQESWPRMRGIGSDTFTPPPAPKVIVEYPAMSPEDHYAVEIWSERLQKWMPSATGYRSSREAKRVAQRYAKGGQRARVIERKVQ